MTAFIRPSTSQQGEHDHTTSPARRSSARISGDEFFVPASHVLVADRRVSHPAFRLWCVLHRLWFLREPPAMGLLQELMGSSVDTPDVQDQAANDQTWRPATRRSVERWLRELELAGWLVWRRREETTRRYHLRTSARTAADAAVLTELRALLNSGKATVVDIQALLSVALDNENDALQASATTLVSHESRDTCNHATRVSHDRIDLSHDAIDESSCATPGSYGSIAGSHAATPQSHTQPTDRTEMPQRAAPLHETHQKRDQENPPPSPCSSPADGGDGGGLTPTQRFLIRAGFSTRAAHQFRHLELRAARRDFVRRRDVGQGIGAIVSAWRVDPPVPAAAGSARVSSPPAAQTKAQAIAIAPPDASELDIQYLMLDLEEGVAPAEAVLRLRARHAGAQPGGGI